MRLSVIGRISLSVRKGYSSRSAHFRIWWAVLNRIRTARISWYIPNQGGKILKWNVQVVFHDLALGINYNSFCQNSQ